MAFVNPFARTHLPDMPSMLHVIAESMLAHRQRDLVLDEGDVLICPPVRRDLSFMDWSHHAELFSDAHTYMTRWIEDHRGERGDGFAPITGARGRPALG
jgi:NTE family protein